MGYVTFSLTYIWDFFCLFPKARLQMTLGTLFRKLSLLNVENNIKKYMIFCNSKANKVIEMCRHRHLDFYVKSILVKIAISSIHSISVVLRTSKVKIRDL